MNLYMLRQILLLMILRIVMNKLTMKCVTSKIIISFNKVSTPHPQGFQNLEGVEFYHIGHCLD